MRLMLRGLPYYKFWPGFIRKYGIKWFFFHIKKAIINDYEWWLGELRFNCLIIRVKIKKWFYDV